MENYIRSDRKDNVLHQHRYWYDNPPPMLIGTEYHKSCGKWFNAYNGTLLSAHHFVTEL